MTVPQRALIWRNRGPAGMLPVADIVLRRAGRDDERDRGTMKHTVLFLPLLLGLLGCTPTVAVEAPKDPITINLNIKLDADVKLRVEEKAKTDVEKNPIF
jgi:YnbE-like lipoprotein